MTLVAIPGVTDRVLDFSIGDYLERLEPRAILQEMLENRKRHFCVETLQHPSLLNHLSSLNEYSFIRLNNK